MKIRDEVRRFLGTREKKLRIDYTPKRLTAAAEWYRLRNPVGMIWRGFWFRIVFSKLPPCRIKNFLYRLHGVKIGKDVTIADDVYIDPLFPELITLEDGVILGTHCVLPAHGIGKKTLWLGKTTARKFAVIGAYSYIRPGVEIGENSVVSNFSRVLDDVKENVVVGNPNSKVIKKLK